jgi:hypothetical protein
MAEKNKLTSRDLTDWDRIIKRCSKLQLTLLIKDANDELYNRMHKLKL